MGFSHENYVAWIGHSLQVSLPGEVGAQEATRHEVVPCGSEGEEGPSESTGNDQSEAATTDTNEHAKSVVALPSTCLSLQFLLG